MLILFTILMKSITIKFYGALRQSLCENVQASLIDVHFCLFRTQLSKKNNRTKRNIFDWWYSDAFEKPNCRYWSLILIRGCLLFCSSPRSEAKLLVSVSKCCHHRSACLKPSEGVKSKNGQIVQKACTSFLKRFHDNLIGKAVENR